MTELLIGIVIGAVAAIIKFAHDKGAKIIKEERDAHDRITEADTGVGATDADRIAELQRLGQRWDRD